jgi:hypothetical protein
MGKVNLELCGNLSTLHIKWHQTWHLAVQCAIVQVDSGEHDRGGLTDERKKKLNTCSDSPRIIIPITTQVATTPRTSVQATKEETQGTKIEYPLQTRTKETKKFLAIKINFKHQIDDKLMRENLPTAMYGRSTVFFNAWSR